MRLLLDTHIFLWFITSDSRLPRDVEEVIRDPANEVFLSAVSAWEAIVKHALGKLSLPEPGGVPACAAAGAWDCDVGTG